ncbi:MAG: phosphate/phosphite/phosphonate ABC transporter substrate-binding protein [Helicobacteraceae bacterium]|jgi:phosphonate transport system substrate-binding protein|nr:phosphate/phosphite/phosphonate ABC transporter substrate-binding protein [Helicobacteraceae bacterium]
MWRRLALSVPLFVCVLLSAVRGEDSGDIKIGIAPFNSTIGLMRIHRPIRDYLSQELGRDIILFTSSGHAKFFEDALEGRFDVVITPAHFVPSMIKTGFVPLVIYKSTLDVLIVVRTDSGINSIEDLRGRTIGLSDKLSLFYIAGMQWLEGIGLRNNYFISEQRSHLTAIIAVAAKQIDVAITGKQPLMQADKNISDQLMTLDFSSIKMPSLVTLAHKRLGDETIKQMSKALDKFENTEEGKDFFQRTGYLGYRHVVDSDIEAMRPYMELMEELRRKQDD